MVEIFEIAGIRVGVAPIPEGDPNTRPEPADREFGVEQSRRQPSTRRMRERAAVAEVVKALAGEDAVLDHNADGAPLLPRWNISVTHSRRYAMAAIDRTAIIGIDAEDWREALRRVKSKFLSARELEMFVTDEQLLKAWTVKEAVYKAAGQKRLSIIDGISIAPDMTHATAAGFDYALHFTQISTTQIALALQKTPLTPNKPQISGEN